MHDRVGDAMIRDTTRYGAATNTNRPDRAIVIGEWSGRKDETKMGILRLGKQVGFLGL